jgi:prepilin peptidase CpaA
VSKSEAEWVWGALLALLAAATVCDLRSRRAPAWLTGGGIGAGILVAAWAGSGPLGASLLRVAAGGLVLLPFVWRRWLGGADALLLAAVGAWHGWRLALWAAWWTAMAGAALALAVWGWRVWRSRARRSTGAGVAPASAVRSEPFPYVPAILVGTALTLLLGG